MTPFLRTVARALLGAMSLAFTLAALADSAGKAPTMKMTMPIPADITTPATLDTRLGRLDFFDGIPSPDTVDKVYEHLDLQRGVDVFLNAMPGASLYAMREGLRSIGVNNSSVALFESLMDSRSLFLTGNTESVYLIGWLDLKDGPMVVESPPNTLGLMDDFWFRYLTDMGNAGPDKGQGGKYLVLPPGYQDEVPAGYHVVRSPTYNVWVASRGFVVKGDPRPAVDNVKQGFRLYPLAAAQNPPATRFINASGLHFSTIHANNQKFFAPQTRSELQTNQQFPSLGSQSQNIRANADGSHDLYFGPVAPAGKESNWIQTVPGKSWFTILRLYGPLPTWFDKSWQPGEIELQK